MTPHFKPSEMAQATRHGFQAKAYPEVWYPRLRILFSELETIRAVWGKPLVILSGYRSREYNTAIGGAPKSQHVLGKAADIVVKGVPAKVVRDTIRQMMRDGKLPRVRGLGEYPTFTHVDIRRNLATWRGSRKDN